MTTYNVDYGGIFAWDFSINEALLPGGTLANAKIHLFYNDLAPVPSPQVSVNGQQTNVASFAEVPWLSYGNYFQTQFIDNNVGGSTFMLTFDADKDVASWTISGVTGGSGDYFSTVSGDCLFYCGTAGSYTLAGSWDVTPLDVVPVPLPPSVLMVVAALLCWFLLYSAAMRP